MQAMLTSLSQIQGVSGIAVFSPAGDCILHQMPAPFEPALLGRIFADLRTVLDAFQYLDDSSATDSLVCRFEQGNLIVRPVGINSVLLLTTPTVNMAMVNVGFKVASLKMERSAEAAHTASLTPPPPQFAPVVPPEPRLTPTPPLAGMDHLKGRDEDPT